MARSLSKRHHTAPEFYLKRFAAPPTDRKGTVSGFWVYTRKEAAPRWGTPHNTSVRTNFNSYELPGGGRTDHPEDFLQQLDGLAAPVLDRIVLQPESMTPDDRRTLSVFIAAMTSRSVKQREYVTQQVTAAWRAMLVKHLNNGPRMSELLRQYHEERGRSVNLEQVRRGIEEGRVLLKLNQHAQIGYSLGTILPLADWLETLWWWLLEAPSGREFVTSDAPVVILGSGPKDEAFGMPTKDVQVTFPVDAIHCLWLTAKGPGGPILADRKLVDDIVRRTTLEAHRQVYSRHKNVTVARWME